jgi:hypothetical protein
VKVAAPNLFWDIDMGPEHLFSIWELGSRDALINIPCGVRPVTSKANLQKFSLECHPIMTEIVGKPLTRPE